jgi:hypothetical protein
LPHFGGLTSVICAGLRPGFSLGSQQKAPVYPHAERPVKKPTQLPPMAQEKRSSAAKKTRRWQPFRPAFEWHFL